LPAAQWDALNASIKVVDDEVDARVARMTSRREPTRLDFPI
jgi:hypothetical protein